MWGGVVPSAASSKELPAGTDRRTRSFSPSPSPWQNIMKCYGQDVVGETIASLGRQADEAGVSVDERGRS